ncbi:MAG: HEAT repeat domain-containing protein [Phycisphaeraceae bacterium]|nr:HEAT repeat domain-containing protein [Phycisphaeraceae bacterium]
MKDLDDNTPPVGGPVRLLLPWAMVACALLVVATLDGCGDGDGDRGPEAGADPEDVAGEPAEPRLAFVEEASCHGCHGEQHAQWRGSHHQLAMQPATEQTVLADFDDTTFERFGVTSRFYRKGAEFWVRTQGPDGKPADYRVHYTFGVDPIQQYLVRFEGGRYQCLTIGWDKDKKRWFDLQPEEKIEPADPLHWTRSGYNWNRTCAYCHSTDLKKNYDHETRTYRTTYEHVTVSCQACHGPGEKHLAWAKAKAAGESVGKDAGFPVDFATSAQTQVESCARCHMLNRQTLSREYRHGDPLLDHYRPSLLVAGSYHPDGQIDGEVYVYGSYLQSKMYHAGVRCTDCHNPHTARVHVQGNALCVRCHQQSPPKEQFKTLVAKNYDTPAHHHHKPGSPGASCVNCHMPEKTYMVIDPRRDHSLRIPRPDLSVSLGVPNACTKCHEKRSKKEDAAWAAEAFKKWWGDRQRPVHYGQIFAAARNNRLAAEPALISLAGDDKQPAIVRATALQLLQRYQNATAQRAVVEAALADPEPLVRQAAVGTFGRFLSLPDRDRVARLAPLLTDERRAVRFEAVRMLSGPRMLATMTRSQTENFRRHLAAYRRLLLAEADWPGALVELGQSHENMREYDRAIEYYREAMRTDDQYVWRSRARLRLAHVYYKKAAQREGTAEAEALMDKSRKTLRELIGQNKPPGMLKENWNSLRSEASFMMGQLEATDPDKLPEAGRYFQLAARLNPTDARAHYNHGLSLEHQKKFSQAEKAFGKALKLVPTHHDYLLAMARILLKQQRAREAVPYAQQLSRLYRQSPEARQIVRQIQRALGPPR